MAGKSYNQVLGAIKTGGRPLTLTFVPGGTVAGSVTPQQVGAPSLSAFLSYHAPVAASLRPRCDGPVSRSRMTTCRQTGIRCLWGSPSPRDRRLREIIRTRMSRCGGLIRWKSCPLRLRLRLRLRFQPRPRPRPRPRLRPRLWPRLLSRLLSRLRLRLRPPLRPRKEFRLSFRRHRRRWWRRPCPAQWHRSTATRL